MPDTASPGSVEIRVKLFARASELAGCRELAIQFPSEPTIEQVKQKLVERFPALSVIQSQLLPSLDAEYATGSQKVNSGAEVAFFPPVSGG